MENHNSVRDFYSAYLKGQDSLGPQNLSRIHAVQVLKHAWHQDILHVAAVPVRYKDIVIDIAKSVQIFFCQLPAPVRKRGCPPELAQAALEVQEVYRYAAIEEDAPFTYTVRDFSREQRNRVVSMLGEASGTPPSLHPICT